MLKTEEALSWALVTLLIVLGTFTSTPNSLVYLTGAVLLCPLTPDPYKVDGFFNKAVVLYLLTASLGVLNA